MNVARLWVRVVLQCNVIGLFGLFAIMDIGAFETGEALHPGGEWSDTAGAVRGLGSDIC